MYLTDLSIKRPVVATVMSLILVIFGLVVFNEIPTDELKDVERPIVTIHTNYQGASAEIDDTQKQAEVSLEEVSESENQVSEDSSDDTETSNS